MNIRIYDSTEKVNSEIAAADFPAIPSVGDYVSFHPQTEHYKVTAIEHIVKKSNVEPMIYVKQCKESPHAL